MQIVRSTTSMQRLSTRWRREGILVGFVPTMGYLHDGHLSLIREARRRVGPQGKVVVSLYVNPTQFGAHEDLSRYPRDFAGDRQGCAKMGTDALFFPTDQVMYPGRAEGLYSTYVVEENLSLRYEGASRPTHFRGVTTIVAKLFHIVQPDVAIFGAKDFQQASVIQRMVHDLNFPVKVIVAPTVREADGLAMSSRNAYLNPLQREQAVCLYRSIQQARQTVAKSSKPVAVRGLIRDLTRRIHTHSEARVDYIAFFHPETLKPVDQVKKGDHMALAVFLGKTRLIDNSRL